MTHLLFINLHMFYIAFLLFAMACENNTAVQLPAEAPVAVAADSTVKNATRVIHVFVALCDNKNQGIVPVPAAIGNGQDAANNLYWGCSGGVKGYFKKMSSWKLIRTIKDPSDNILERCIFQNAAQNAYLVADAYDGIAIRQCIADFFTAASGGNANSMMIEDKPLPIGGHAQLVAYVGHDGLMEFSLDAYPAKKNDTKRETIILSCISKRYFKYGIQQSGAQPLLWSTGLMSPEAYTLEAALSGWLNKETPDQIRARAAKAYDKYQKCGVKAATRLLVTGW